MNEYNTKNAIQTAIQMEKDGYEFYSKAAAQTQNEMGRTIFEGLAKDELIHLDIFKKMFEDQVGTEEWDDLVSTNQKYTNLPIFPKDLKTVEGTNPNTSELDALRMAMDSEKEAIDYYTEIWSNTEDEQTKKILETIIEQEKKHYFLLEQEFNHITTTGYWFEFDYLGG